MPSFGGLKGGNMEGDEISKAEATILSFLSAGKVLLAFGIGAIITGAVFIPPEYQTPALGAIVAGLAWAYKYMEQTGMLAGTPHPTVLP